MTELFDILSIPYNKSEFKERIFEIFTVDFVRNHMADISDILR